MLADIDGQPMVARVVERAAAIRGLDGVVVAVPAGDWSAIVGALAGGRGPVAAFGFSGPAEDVLRRYDDAARAVDADIVMRLTADDPVLDPALCDDVLKGYLARGSPHAFAHNVAPNTDGWDCEVFSAQALRLAALRASDPYDREHVTPWLKRHGFVIFQPTPGDAPKLSVDTLEELETVRAIYKHIGKGIFSRAEALAACRGLGMIS